MKFGIALFPSKKLQDTVNQYRKRYDARYSYIAPHITVKEAFEAEEHEKPQIEELKAWHLNTSLRKLKSKRFQVLLQKNRSFTLKLNPMKH